MQKLLIFYFLLLLVTSQAYCAYQYSQCGTIKIHRTVAQSSATATTWVDCWGFTEIADETQGEVAELNADGKTINILQDGLYQFGGCLHCQNNTGLIRM